MLARLLSLLCRSNTSGLCRRSLPFYTMDFSGQREEGGMRQLAQRDCVAQYVRMRQDWGDGDGWKVEGREIEFEEVKDN